MSFTLHGLGVSGGIAIGRAMLMSHATLEVSHLTLAPRMVDKEIERFDKAVNAVKGGHCEVAMAVGFDDMMKFSRARALSEMAEGPKIDSTILPAAFFAMWAVRRMH